MSQVFQVIKIMSQVYYELNFFISTQAIHYVSQVQGTN